MVKRWYMNPERYSGAPFTHQPEFVCTPVEFKWGGYVLASDYDLLSAELAEAKAALQRIKAHVCGERNPRWMDDWATGQSRAFIADVIDAAMAAQEKGE